MRLHRPLVLGSGLVVAASVTVAMIGIGSASAITQQRITVTPTDTQGWSHQDTETNPVYVPGPTGTDGNGSLEFATPEPTDHVDYYHAASGLLSSVSDLSYSEQSSGGAQASYEIQILAGPDANIFTSLVWEPYQQPGHSSQLTGDGKWHTFSDLEDGYWWSTHGIPGDPDSNGSDEIPVQLSTIIAANPAAQLLDFGVSQGSNNAGAVSYVDDVQFDSVLYNFDLNPAGTIGFTAPDSGTYGGSTTLSATPANSSSPVVFSVDGSSDAGVCSLADDGVTLDYTGVGTCVVDANQDGDATTAAAAQVQQSISVGTADLTITAGDVSQVYGSTPSPVTAGYDGFVNGDTAASLSTAPICVNPLKATTGVGTHATTCSGAVDPNYTITYVPGTAKVTKATLTLTIGATTRTYGEDDPTFTATPSGLVNGDSLAALFPGGFTFTATKGAVVSSPTSAPGAYKVTTSVTAPQNYKVVVVAGTMTVTKAALTITADSATRTVGDYDPDFTVTPTGLKNGESLSDLTGTLTFDVFTTRTVGGVQQRVEYSATSPAGSYAIKPGGLTSPDYVITYVNGRMTLSK